MVRSGLQLLITLITVYALPVQSARWFMFRMLRNSGLTTVNAVNHDDCVNQCMVTTGCSAISYQQSTGKCLLSMCNNLDLYRATGWNTYVITPAYVEGRDFRSLQLEWTLTDTCGTSNQGAQSGPKMNLFSTNYGKSFNVYSGKALAFTGTTASQAFTDVDTSVNCPMGNQSFTFMLWANWASVCDAPFIEFYQGSNRYINIWYHLGGLYYGIAVSGTTGCTGNCNYVAYTFTPILNAWYHVAYVYDGSAGTMQVYLNASLVTSQHVGVTNSNIIWDKALIGSSPAGGDGLNGSFFCYKLVQFAATQDEVTALANSCAVGKMRFSG